VEGKFDQVNYNMNYESIFESGIEQRFSSVLEFGDVQNKVI
jgi:hypothetical protein